MRILNRKSHRLSLFLMSGVLLAMPDTRPTVRAPSDNARVAICTEAVSATPQGIGASSIESFFIGMLNLGFAASRPSCAPQDQPLPASFANMIKSDLRAARAGAAAMNSCIRFDLNRFNEVADLVPGMRAGDARKLIIQLFQDYQASIRNSSITCGGIGAAQFESFYAGTLSLGFALVRTTCVDGQLPLPPAVANMIRGDLAQFQAGLAAFASCLSGVTSRGGRTIGAQIAYANGRLGVVTAKESYADLVDLYQLVSASLLNSSCICRCGGGGGRICPNGNLACGYCLGSGIYNKWLQTGGERGVLNCPIMNETDAARSTQGTTGRYAEFRGGDGGYIIWHANGRLAGQSFVVRGCMFKSYKSAGGTRSWLGFPLGDEYRVQGGAKQDFEGGYILWNERTGECSASSGGTTNPSGGTITIVTGTYGQNCNVATGNDTGHLASACNGKSLCRYEISNRIFGSDPASGCAKNYVAEFRCSNSSNIQKVTHGAVTNETYTVVLDCSAAK